MFSLEQVKKLFANTFGVSKYASKLFLPFGEYWIINKLG